MNPLPLEGMRVTTLATNLPGPVAAARLCQLGARVVKVESPGGDPLSGLHAGWYGTLSAGQQVMRLDLKQPDGRNRLHELLLESDLLLTSSRLAALMRLGLEWEALHASYPDLCQVAILGYPAPGENLPGHDLTYQASQGLITPPHLPRALLADLGGAERAVSTALALLLERERGRGAGYAAVSLAEVTESYALSLHFGLTRPGGLLGGGLPGYNLYPTRQGWIAVAALEPHFWQKLTVELGVDPSGEAGEALREAFLNQTARYWQRWAEERDLPVLALPEGLAEQD